MITVYVPSDSGARPQLVQAGERWPEGAIWIDLREPTRDEELAAEAYLGVELPTRQEMRDIEISSRLYQENNALFMTATMIVHADSAHPETAEVTFVLTRRCLVTVRYFDARPFRSFAVNIEKNASACAGPEAVLAGLLDAIVDRIADVLQDVGAELDRLSRTIFEGETVSPVIGPQAPAHQASPKKVDADLQLVLRRLGAAGVLIARSRESLVSVGRVISFVIPAPGFQFSSEQLRHLKSSGHDQQSLSVYADFLSGKVTFFLDATLGLINVEQNKIIKIFSVASVMFLPPTLVASVYGMNFAFMPELNWSSGYPFALLLMVLSSAIPYLYFRRKGWL